MLTPCPEGREIKGGQNPSNTSDWRPSKPGGSQVRVPGGLIGSAGVEPSSTVFGDHPKPGGSQPQGTIYATPEAMLKAVHASGFVEWRGSLQDRRCRYCDVWLGKAGAHEPETHAEDCLFFQIEDFLKETGQL